MSNLEISILVLNGVKDCFEAAEESDFVVCGDGADKVRNWEFEIEEIDEPKVRSVEDGDGWIPEAVGEDVSFDLHDLQTSACYPRASVAEVDGVGAIVDKAGEFGTVPLEEFAQQYDAWREGIDALCKSLCVTCRL